MRKKSSYENVKKSSSMHIRTRNTDIDPRFLANKGIIHLAVCANGTVQIEFKQG